MQQLSGLDATFLYMETPTTPMHTMAILRLGAGPPEVTVESVRSLFLNSLHELPALGQRLIDMPLGLDTPILVDDADFDICNHVARHAGPPMKTMEDVDLVAGDFARKRLDRARPLWRVLFFDGLDGGEYAVVMKIHHAIADGISAAAFLARLLDPVPSPPPVAPRATPVPCEAVPGGPSLLGRSIRNQTRLPFAAARAVLGAAQGAFALWRRSEGVDENRAFWPIPLAAPTPFDGSLSPERSLTRAGASFEDFLLIKRAFDATVNDVLLAACTLAMRHYISARGKAPDRPLIASIPVSIRTGTDPSSGNRVSNMLVRLPVQLDSVHSVMEFVRRETRNAKRAHELMGSHVVVPVLEALSMPALGWLAHQHARLGLADHHRPACNVIISNIPGPAKTLFFAGVPLLAAYPFGPLMDGTALNLTAISYAGRMQIGLNACPTRAPHPAELAGEFECAVAILRDASAEARSPRR